MATVDTVRGALRGALSRGPGYEPQPINAQASYEAVSGYFLDLRAKTLNTHTRFLTGRGDVYGLTATSRAQRALGWWERHLSGEESARSEFVGEVDQLRALAEAADGRLLWRYDMDVPKYRCRAPWYSSMAQGQAASVFVRAHLVTGAEEYANAALGAIEALLGPDSPYGLVTMTSAGPILEECPTDPASHILNGWIYALWGLWDVAAGLNNSAARRLFDQSATALVEFLPRYDTGWWTLYSLYTLSEGKPDTAKPFYHRIHIDQMDVMARLTGYDAFREAHARWTRYDRRLPRARAVTVKARSVLSERRARSETP